MFDAIEMEEMLRNGKRILAAHPEFADMSPEKVIDCLYDGTEKMTRDRWGAAAHLVTERLDTFEPYYLAEVLAQIKGGSLIYECIGYLLQNNYNVNLEMLLLEADRQHRFSEIVKYVSPNLPFEKKFYQENVRPIANLMERHINETECSTLINYYAEHIANTHSQRLALDVIGELTCVAEYRLVCNLQRKWYLSSKDEAIAYIDQLIKHRSVWSKKAALHFLDVSICVDYETFRSHFSEIEKLVDSEAELREDIISAFTHYIMELSNEEENDAYYDKVLEYLNRIPFGTVAEKRVFLESVRYNADIPRPLQKLFAAVAASPVEKDQYIVKLIAEVLYPQVHRGEWREALRIMMLTFGANKYLADYRAFFSATNMLDAEMAKHSGEITVEAIKYMLADNAFEVFFGLGLLLNLGDLRQYSISDSNALSETQLIHMMTGILYYADDSNKVCSFAFEFLRLGDKHSNGYLEFCVKSVYKNYPMTFSSVAKNYENSDNQLQKQLAGRIIEIQKETTDKRSLASAIKDLQPSAKHNYIYGRAMAEQNRQISQKADENSFFSSFFGKRILKYGIRSAFLSSGGNGNLNMRVSPFQTISYQMEVPLRYIEDPVNYAIEKQHYLKELKTDAIGHKRVSVTVEGKR